MSSRLYAISCIKVHKYDWHTFRTIFRQAIFSMYLFIYLFSQMEKYFLSTHELSFHVKLCELSNTTQCWSRSLSVWLYLTESGSSGAQSENISSEKDVPILLLLIFYFLAMSTGLILSSFLWVVFYRNLHTCATIYV